MKVNAEEDQFGSKDEDEEGEITNTDNENEHQDSIAGKSVDDLAEVEVSMTDYEDSSDDELSTARRKKKKKKRNKRISDQISKLSDALMAMQNVMVQQGIMNNNKEKKTASAKKCQGSVESVINTNSETTIYENAVYKESKPFHDGIERLPVQCDGDLIDQDDIRVVDDEITLNLSRNKHNLTSSDEQADTSEELINVTDQFIADCAA